jgi:hypothetical protein
MKNKPNWNWRAVERWAIRAEIAHEALNMAAA